MNSQFLTFLMLVILHTRILVLAKENNKPYRLKVISILALTGSETSVGDFRQCRATQKMVAEIVNNRSDILPNYNVEIEFLDEGANGVKTAASVISYVRNEDFRRDNYATQLAPVTIGAMFTPGCKSWGSSASFMNMVMLAGSCTAPTQTDQRNIYPNMYRVRSGAQLSLSSRLHFMKTLTNWRHIAIITLMNTNSYNMETSIIFYEMSTKVGFEVAAFEASADFNMEMMQHLKKADLRIITVETAEPSYTVLFLCQAYKVGLRGQKYQFIFQLLAYADPNIYSSLLPPGCTRENYMEQLKFSIYVGTPFPILVVPPAAGITTLGHNLGDFEKLFAAVTNNEKRPDFPFRHICYDLALQAILTLNNTEFLLAQQNLTLGDYHNHPEDVMRAANKSAAQITFNNLRHGLFYYSPRLEWDYEPQLVATWSQEKGGLQVRYQVTLLVNATDYRSIDSYVMKPIIPFDTPFPRDARMEVIEGSGKPLFVFVLVACIAGVIFFIQLGVLFASLKDDTSNRFFLKNILNVVSFACMDAAAVINVIMDEMNSTAVCQALPFLVTISISLLHGSLSVRLVAYNKCLKTEHSRVSPGGRHYLRTPEILDERRLAINLGIFTLVNVIICIVWVAVDPFRMKITEAAHLNEYHENIDTFVRVMTVTCLSAYSSGWIGALLALNGLPLLIGVLYSARMRHHLKTTRRYQELGHIMMSLVISATLFPAAIVVAFLATSDAMLDLTISSFLLVHSAVNSGILYYKLLIPIFSR